MGSYHKYTAASADRGTTLSSLKDQLHSLNMRMLLAMQSHDVEALDEIKKQIAEVQREIDHMSLGGGRQKQL